MSATDPDIAALHRYFLWADVMRVRFHEQLKTTPKWEEAMMFPYMSYWYAGTYALIEGWLELKLSDRQIDGLLQSPNVELLKRYRNGAFHFQKQYFDSRFLDFMGGEDSAKWIAQLQEAFSQWFLEYFKKRES